jgi:hypothetical protein
MGHIIAVGSVAHQPYCHYFLYIYAHVNVISDLDLPILTSVERGGGWFLQEMSGKDAADIHCVSVSTLLCQMYPWLNLSLRGFRMISDFFHPAVGGVENHIFMLSANLIRRGHKVCKAKKKHLLLFFLLLRLL